MEILYCPFLNGITIPDKNVPNCTFETFAHIKYKGLHYKVLCVCTRFAYTKIVVANENNGNHDIKFD